MGLSVHVPSLLFAPFAGAGRLPLELLIVFGVAKVVAEVFERLGQPGMVGEIVAGILIGPTLLGWVHPGPVLDALAQIGVMFLLFHVGLEVTASDLLQVKWTALLVAALGVAVPFGVGCLIMKGFGGSWIEAFFVGASLVATSVAVTAHVLKTKGYLQQRASRVILAAAVIDDVLGLLVLSLVSSLAERRVNVAGLIGTFVLAAGFTVILARYGTHAAGKIVPHVKRKLKAEEAQFNVALVLLFSLSVLAVWLGVAAIVGAFLAGMVLSKTTKERVPSLTPKDRVLSLSPEDRVPYFVQGVTELLVPFFLVSIGLHVDLAVFRSGATVLLAIAITGAAILSKFAGCGLGALSCGRTDVLRVGVGMIPRGEVGMVVAQIGLTLGVINGSIYAVVITMTVITTLLAPPLLKYAYRGVKPGLPEENYTLT